jgi:hypothetical protein
MMEEEWVGGLQVKETKKGHGEVLKNRIDRIQDRHIYTSRILKKNSDKGLPQLLYYKSGDGS